VSSSSLQKKDDAHEIKDLKNSALNIWIKI
jgi:hypothetical protein